MSDKNYYNVLGVKKDATEIELRKAYHKKALECHPDKKGGDDSMIKIVNEAYEILSDKTSRHKYDNPNENVDLPDILKEFFNMNTNVNMNMNTNMNKRRGDHRYEVKIELKDVYFGIKKTLKLKIVKKCFNCRTICKQCSGGGILKITQQIGPFMTQHQVVCNGCNGVGIFNDKIKECNCNDKFEIKTEHIIEIIIEKNVKNGEQRIYENLGEQIVNIDEIAGNLVVVILIQEDINFTREQNNLIYKCKLTVIETLIGKEIIVPHFGGDMKINIVDVFGVIDYNKRYHIRNKGLDELNDMIFIFIYDYKIINLSIEEKLVLKKINIE